MKLVIVSPCYNEEYLIADSSAKLNNVIESMISRNKISNDSFVLFVNDGSSDETWREIVKSHSAFPHVCGLDLARNVGHQYAILAGMMKVRNVADAVITIDSDLQDDLNAIEQMIDRFKEGNDIVYGVKTDRGIDPWRKRIMASLFYKVQGWLGVKSVKNHADFRLLSRKALDTLSAFPERNMYLRGIIPLLGLKSAMLDDVLSPRACGRSKYTSSKQIQLAIDGITSFTTKPLELIFLFGVIMMIISLSMFVYVVISLAMGHVIAGWASLMLSVWFIGAVLTIGVGLIGIYIGKIYMEVKQRPLFTERDSIGLLE